MLIAQFDFKTVSYTSSIKNVSESISLSNF